MHVDFCIWDLVLSLLEDQTIRAPGTSVCERHITHPTVILYYCYCTALTSITVAFSVNLVLHCVSLKCECQSP